MLLYSVVSGVVGEAFPGTVEQEVRLMFPAPTYAGDELELGVLVESVTGRRVGLGLWITGPDGEVTCRGDMVVAWEDPR
jgi:acyl-CoA thioesterase FadM